MAELALDDVQQDTLAGELDGMRMAQLMRREADWPEAPAHESASTMNAVLAPWCIPHAPLGRAWRALASARRVCGGELGIASEAVPKAPVPVQVLALIDGVQMMRAVGGRRITQEATVHPGSR